MSDDVIKRYFSAFARDVTPKCVRRTVNVLYAPICIDSEFSNNCAAILSNAENERANRISSECHRTKFIQRRAFRRFCAAIACENELLLSQIEFLETDLGQPYLVDFPEVNFSFSSCKSGLLGAWSFKKNIGVDIENQTRPFELSSFAHRYFSRIEACTIEEADNKLQARTFFQIWCLKEATLKSIGQGLPFGLNEFQFKLRPNLQITHAPAAYGGPKRFNIKIIEETPCCAALAIHSRV